MLHELFLTTTQTTKIKNSFAKNMSTDIKVSKHQMSKKTQSSRSFGSLLANLGKKPLASIAIPLARCDLASNATNKFERKISGKGTLTAGKRFISFISSEDINYIFKTKKSLEDSIVLTDGITETVNYEKNEKVDFFLLVSTFSLFISETSHFFSSKRYKLKKS